MKMDVLHHKLKLFVIAPSDEIHTISWRKPLDKDSSLKLSTIEYKNTDQWLIDVQNQLETHCYQKYHVALVLIPKKIKYNSNTITQLIKSGADDVLSLLDNDIIDLFDEVKNYLLKIIDDVLFLEDECGLIGHSDTMQRFRKTLAIASRNIDSNTLLLGETGTGKCLAARALHRLNIKTCEHLFHAVDCGSITDTLFGSELFGHISGAFTGALSTRYGAFKTVGKGTLLLDEIGELSLALQGSFLNALQERKYRPLGSDRENSIDCQIIAATNQNLPEMVNNGRFRADLFYRLDGVRIYLPTLNEHREDIPELLSVFMNNNLSNSAEHYEIDSDVLSFLAVTDYPGNIRQLENIARDLKNSSCGKRIRLTHLPQSLLSDNIDTEIARSDKVDDMLECGLSWDEMQEKLRQHAANFSIQMAKKSCPSATRTEQIKIAANRLNVSTRSIYDWSK